MYVCIYNMCVIIERDREINGQTKTEKTMYGQEWRTVYVLTRWFAHTVHHDSACIMLFLTHHNESVNDDDASTLGLTRSVAYFMVILRNALWDPAFIITRVREKWFHSRWNSPPPYHHHQTHTPSSLWLLAKTAKKVSCFLSLSKYHNSCFCRIWIYIYIYIFKYIWMHPITSIQTMLLHVDFYHALS